MALRHMRCQDEGWKWITFVNRARSRLHQRRTNAQDSGSAFAPLRLWAHGELIKATITAGGHDAKQIIISRTPGVLRRECGARSTRIRSSGTRDQGTAGISRAMEYDFSRLERGCACG